MDKEVLLQIIRESAKDGRTRLDLHRSGLTELPPEIGQLADLIELDLGGNRLSCLPPEIGRLGKLTKLSLWDNQLAELPAEIGQLTGLAELELGFNRLSCLPVEIGRLDKLTKLQLWGNQLAELPAELWQLTSLTILDLGGNRLSCLPAEIGRLGKLTKLELSGNQLAKLPAELWQLTGLTELDFGDNHLSCLPAEIGRLGKLTTLSLSDNHLSCLPAEIGRLGKLTTLELRGNQLAELPAELWQLTSLTILCLSGNRLSCLPAEIGRLGKLTTLELRGNQLSELPAELGQLTGLTELDLGDNRLSCLPAEIGRLGKLTTLSLRGNQLAELPAELWQLTSLTILCLSGNRLSCLPAEIGRLGKLTGLEFWGNQLAELPAELWQLTGLTELYLGDNRLSCLPVEIGRLGKLTKLSLRDNQLAELPAELWQLTSLTILYLGGNRLSCLPAEIGRLGKLTKLYFGINQLAELPAELWQLTDLTELDLSGNRLSCLPVEIGRLGKLTKLELRNNQLAELPTELWQLTGLTELNLSGNRLSCLPAEIGRLGKLTKLYLRGNQLAELPPQIMQLASLTDLELRENPLVSPPLEVASKGITAVQRYFTDLDKESRLVNEVKVLLIGEGGAGKTSLARCVVEERFNKDEPSTPGIRITGWQAGAVKVNIWDFGGQEIMHATHQFFLSKRSLYVLVLDGRRDERPEYWLRHIESFGGSSPVLIVLNKQDSNPGFDLNRSFLLRKHPGIRGFHPTSCAKDVGIAEFRESLLRELALVQMAETRWPNNWFQIKQRLEELQEPCISWERYKDLCTEAQTTEAMSQDVLVDFLHDLGIVVHFRDSELKDTQVLDPKWVTTAVYKIVTSAEVAAAGGILRLARLDEILRQQAGEEYAYPQERQKYLVGLMNKFELCFSLDEETVLIPQLLSVAEPDLRAFDLDGEQWLRFVLRYDDFLPLSVMPRFMVKIHPDIKDRLLWRTGVVLENKDLGTTAVVRSDNEDRRISICVAGAQRKNFLAVILLFFREINGSFEKLRVSELVPMPDDPECTASYKTLVTHAEQGLDKYIPDGSDKVYSVAALLGMVQLEGRDDGMERVLDILLTMEGQVADKEALAKKLVGLLELKPSICGVGLNLNALIDKLIDKRQELRRRDRDRERGV